MDSLEMHWHCISKKTPLEIGKPQTFNLRQHPSRRKSTTFIWHYIIYTSFCHKILWCFLSNK